MFFEAHRLSVFTPRSLDVDVVLDLMIHDLDIVLSFVNSPVREVRAVGLPVLSPKVDIANVRLEFENGCVANFTASRVSTERVRKLRFFQPHQYLSLDFARQDLLMIDVTAASRFISANPNPAQIAAMEQMLAALPKSHGEQGTHPSAGLSLKKIPVQPGEPLRLEIASFLESIRTRTTPLVTAQEGRNALALALEINEAIAAHTQRAGL
jgi:predicted dehydrogenase